MTLEYTCVDFLPTINMYDRKIVMVLCARSQRGKSIVLSARYGGGGGGVLLHTTGTQYIIND